MCKEQFDNVVQFLKFTRVHFNWNACSVQTPDGW